jgi:murein L,D-transpeptidase YcbB/YkuD
MTELFSKKTIQKCGQTLALLSCLLLPVPSFANLDMFKESFLEKTESYRQTGKLIIGSHVLYAPYFVRGVYPLNNYQPLWNMENRQALFDAIETLSEDGLNPQEYVFPEVVQYIELEKEGSLDVTKHLDLDLLLSEGLIRALYNLAFGKVDPVALDPNINFTKPLTKNDLAPILLKHIQNGEILELFNQVRPKQPRYAALKSGLEHYRLIQSNGGWEKLPGGKTLKPGETDARVPLLRNRLQRTEDHPNAPELPGSEYFDETLKTSLEAFQGRHGLEADGAVGPNTLAALNAPVEDRIDQIRINLERQRWYLNEVEGEFIVVDIAGFKAYWIENGDIVWEEIVQVGKEFTSTPVFKNKIQYLDFNPTWTIPPGIINRSIWPNLKKDSAYLKKKGYELYSLDGKTVDAEAVDWSTTKGFPYVVRQPPGPDNALGLVKFMFPNPHFVFLHDTNHRELFDRTRRTFSSGCIRLRNPFDLAEKLLAGQSNWNRAKIDQIIASGETVRVNLDKPMRIIIGYRTAFAVDDKVHFKRDIYNRDPSVLEALEGKFTVRKQDMPKGS